MIFGGKSALIHLVTLKKVVIVNIEHSEHGEQHATIGEVRRHTVRLMYVTLVLIVLLRRNSMVREYTVTVSAMP